MLNLKSNFTWLITGTPTNNRFHWLDYINIISKSNFNIDIFHTFRTKLPEVIQQMIQKNTKDSLKDKIKIPPVIFENELLDHSIVEQYIYQSALGNEEEMIQLCTHVLVSERHFKILGNKPITLEQIHTKMINHNKKEITRFNRKLEILVKRFSELKQEESTTELLNQFKENKENYEQIILQAKARLNIFQNLESKLKEKCAICLEPFKDVIPVVSKCGHLFCSSCLSTMFQNNINVPCPMCRKPLIKDELLIIKKNIKITGQNKYLRWLI